MLNPLALPWPGTGINVHDCGHLHPENRTEAWPGNSQGTERRTGQLATDGQGASGESGCIRQSISDRLETSGPPKVRPRLKIWTC